MKGLNSRPSGEIGGRSEDESLPFRISRKKLRAWGMLNPCGCLEDLI
jgi:hypothetical protein